MDLINDFSKMLAKEIAKNNEELLQTYGKILLQKLHDLYIRPLQESVILKKVEVAKRLNISPSTVTQIIDTVKLQTTVDGYVTEYHLREYLTRHIQFNPQTK